ncbi:MAG: tRNA (adenosine(37)-N6)-dimethylallyltransferase MiaA [Chlorobiaceae bacterium]|jgi:tRNA dimethylallyltransferase|nr:tRNA (adenosine(37)-N6)-dimethylallyltransferase MiaA [Chlorobiaceae bacterium]
MSFSSSHSRILVILGPTASGKSELALAVARKTGGEIISADSRQIYRELDIGAAKPSPEALLEIRHHFIDEKNIGEPFTAGHFAFEAAKRIEEIRLRGKRPIIAGGSTLYIQGLLEGFADLPETNPVVRARLLDELHRYGKEAMYGRLMEKDPEQASTLDPTKTHRLLRSLEIIEITGMSVTELQSKGKRRGTGLQFHTLGLSMPREMLYERINYRTEKMLDAGLLYEAEKLYKKYQSLLESRRIQALQSVGYQELFQYFEGKIDLTAAISLIKQHTRNYAKRQMTFFNNRLAASWESAPESDSEIETLAERLAGME